MTRADTAADVEIRLSVSPGEHRTALLRDGRLELAAVERPDRPDGVGDIHRARVVAIAEAMSGAFLQLGGGETAFLPESEGPLPKRPIAKSVSEGDSLVVKISRAAQGGKGPRVTARLAPAELAGLTGIAGNGAALLRRGAAAPFRFSEKWPTARILTDAAMMAAALRTRLGHDRVALTHGYAFDDELEADFAQLAESVVALHDGGRLHIHPTPALTAIDVDAGTVAGTRDPLAQLRMNKVAAGEVARQIRLRNLGGAILVDFAGLSPSRREALLPPLTDALRLDPLAPQLLGLTRLGLVEIVRRRVHPPLHEILGLPTSTLSHLLAALRRAAREAAAVPGRRLRLRAAAETLKALDLVPGAFHEYRSLAGRDLVLRVDERLRSGQEEIEEDD